MARVPEDLTVVFYTANQISDYFMGIVTGQIKKAARGIPIVSVSKKPMDFGENIWEDTPRSHLNLYKQALLGAKMAETKYIALCEDDVLYSPEHFKHRPKDGRFAYNRGYWCVYTWNPKVFSWKGRRNLHSLICERDIFIEAIQERVDNPPKGSWGEPGRYERILGLKTWPVEDFWTNPPNIVFSHEDAISFGNLGTRKRLGELRAKEIPYWGKSKDVMKFYETKK
jgi:hypothetical protein